MSKNLQTWLATPQDGAPCTIIAEVAQAHDGSLGTAHAYIDAAATAGADAVKFQTHIAAAESTPHEPWRVKFSDQDETRYDYWKRMEFTPEQWAGLKRHADDAGLMFLSSAFSLEAVELLKKIGIAGWKVASGEITNLDMVSAMSATGQPMLISTGMSDFDEIDAAVAAVQ
ncbi:MAG: N-acetylneuraminate synthase family protein, partial [Aestuariivirgaceae bacterium]